ncbi:FAD-dependent monooxygenase [Actinophytocola sp.]|uniref:FAD-dependent monooxygenase n=1 Tax=Actinophytocola sp. TaxID=1872138 RepID=UPI002D806F9E|nr:FAD-dependent monooxygenase [Actinophytocola sp.]HET9139218.1 FAD-dependent monooxygenase [Actinophytocola sp.]
MDNFHADVIIVGAGPTGLMLAGELRLQGVSAIVVDRLAEPMRQSRALGFSARTIEEFDQRGLLRFFGEVGVIPIGHFGGVPIDYRVIEGGSYGARGVPQSRTEGILASWAGNLGADVRRGHEVVGLTTDEDGAEVEVRTPDGPARLRGRFVVGCDGGKSTIRKLADIPFPGTDPVIEMWMADVAGLQLRPRFSGEAVPGGMVMVLPLGPIGQRVAVYERKAALRLEQPTFEEVAAAFARLTGEDITVGQPMWVSWFTDASRQASEYRRGRVLLAGDAAHIHMPIGGQGMSAGIQDAVNLGWKLAAEIRGDGPAGLLDTYHTERHPVAARVVANTLAQRILYLSDDEMQPLREVFAELVSYEDVQRHLAGMVTGLDIRFDMGPGDHPLLGRRLPDVELDGETTTFQALHPARGVLFDLAGDPGLREIASAWAGRVDTVTAAPTERGALDGVSALLARPDGYIAWVSPAGPDAEDLGEALRRWFGAPA